MAVTFCEECGHNVGLPHTHCKGTEMKKQKPNQILYAFWSYDLCPYMLGGRVQGFISNGNVKVQGYDGMSFKPLAILPDEAGKKALTRLKQLRYMYDKEEKDLKSRYKELARVNVGLGGKE